MATTDLPFDVFDYFTGTVARKEYVTKNVDIYDSSGTNIYKRIEYVTSNKKYYRLPASAALIEQNDIEKLWNQEHVPRYGMIVDIGDARAMKEDSYWKKITSLDYAEKNAQEFYDNVKSLVGISK
jgi:hypothetical protein